MQKSSTTKNYWILHIQQILTNGLPFQYKTTDSNQIFVLFAADIFRRSGHRVCIDILPTELGVCCLVVTIFPLKTCIEFTLRRNDDPATIINQLKNSNFTFVSLRGCGTVINTLLTIMDWALHSGWYVEKTTMSTLTHQITSVSKQRNTALHIVIKRVSTNDVKQNLGTI